MALPARIQHISPYVQELRQKTGYYIGWVPEQYADNVSEDNAYTMLIEDEVVNHASHMHALMAAGDTCQVVCLNPLLRKILNAFLLEMEDFLHARKALIQKGMLMGLGIQRKFYDYRELPGLPGKWKVVNRVQEVDRRRFRIEVDLETKHSYWSLWSKKYDQYIILENRQDNPNAEDGGALQDFLWYFHEEEENFPYHKGLASVVFPWVYAKRRVVQYWADLCESWAKPFFMAFIDSMKALTTGSLGEGYRTHADQVNKILDVFESARARHAAVFDKDTKIDVHESGSVGSNILREFVEIADKKIEKQFLGADLTTSVSSKGGASYALGAIHSNKTEMAVSYSRNRSIATWKKQFLLELCWYNRLHLYTLGLDMPKLSDFELRFFWKKFDRPDEGLVKKNIPGTGSHYNARATDEEEEEEKDTLE